MILSYFLLCSNATESMEQIILSLQNKNRKEKIERLAGVPKFDNYYPDIRISLFCYNSSSPSFQSIGHNPPVCSALSTRIVSSTLLPIPRS